MSEVFTYDTQRVNSLVNPLERLYPATNDEQYWPKVGDLFAKEFSDKSKLDTFKSNWILEKSGLILNALTHQEEAYIKDALNLIIKYIPVEKHIDCFTLFQEPYLGHTTSSFNNNTISFTVEINNVKHDIKNIGFIRSMRLRDTLVFEITTGQRIKDYDVIVEIGGGYGEYARLIRDFGFDGEYYGVDQPTMNEISQFYNESNVNNKYLTDVIDLPDFGDKKVLVISTRAIGELPVLYREELIAAVPKCDWLVSFAGIYNGIDNLNYFCNDFGLRTGKRNYVFHTPFHQTNGGSFSYFVTD